MVQVHESSRFGFCYALGELIGETPTRYIYRNRAGIAYVSKGSLIPVAPARGAWTIESAKRWLKRHQLAGTAGTWKGGANAPQNRAPCDRHHRPHRPKRTHSPDSQGRWTCLNNSLSRS